MTAPVHHAGGPSDPRELAGRTVLVAGAGISGRSAARALTALGASVTLVDDGAPGPGGAGKSQCGRVLGTADAAAGVAGHALVVTSPGWRPANALAAAAVRAGVPLWGDVELAWRLDRAQVYGPARRWLAVTGTNGKTTTTSMLHSILQAAGVASVACGNIGLPILDALAAERRADVLAVELSSFQLHWAPSVVPDAAVVLNIAEDHLDWHGGMDAYTRAKAQVLCGRVAVVGLDDPIASGLRGISTAGRTVGFRLGEPAPGELGVRGGMLVDRAFGARRGDRAAQEDAAAHGEAVALVAADRIEPGGSAGVLDALAAAALARAAGTGADAVAAGLAAHSAGPHRSAHVATVAGVDYVDDSKATNPHAALASIAGRRRVVWIAGGLLKGASVEDLVAAVAPRLAGVVLIGRDRAVIADALVRHAPDVPVTEVAAGEDGEVTGSSSTSRTDADAREGGVMDTVVSVAAEYARAGDTVLLAPAAASMDMFRDYAERGDLFAAAVARLQPGG
ncbi:UDP-N-acetylmuramoyl-L-alanine--D-glutamate ligase [Tomitella cavernea]|uniref:UDP-N-acetylmuramoyl-L-alanine--D-glutamate ligase n=1 Tax=Tomitella cavernea TaxID=1387982 RepID=UPI0027DB74AE|nr:UDP-N-acetylmuramoyl-L-alanine--D-glutamate ligase [Tomitella cavernea]